MISQEDLDHLINPYVSLEETEKRWKDYLIRNGKSGTDKDIESLAKELCDPKGYNIPREAISSLFNREYIPHTFREREWPSHKKFLPPSFEGIQRMEFSDTSLVEEIVQRLSYPKGNSLEYGPNNADKLNEFKDISTIPWCHDVPEFYDGELNHGMYRCECFIEEIPEDFFFCAVCKSKVLWKKHEFYRMPMASEDTGGWGEFFCTKECMMEIMNPSEMQTLIIDIVESCTEDC